MRFILVRFFGYIFRVIGAGVLYQLGLFIKVIDPSAKTYSFKDIYNMDFDDKDDVGLNLDKLRQQIIGFLFVVFMMIIWVLI